LKLDKFGYWVMNDILKPFSENNESDEEDPEPESEEPQKKTEEGKKLKGRCVMTIRFENHGEYLRWKKYFGVGRQWEFLASYPALMRAEIEFTNSLEVEMMAKKVVQLLEAGFNVYSASWSLEEDVPETECNKDQ
jgi:hypothetical protein